MVGLCIIIDHDILTGSIKSPEDIHFATPSLYQPYPHYTSAYKACALRL